MDDSLEFQARRAKSMPERGRKKGILLGAWGQFTRRVEALRQHQLAGLYIARIEGRRPLSAGQNHYSFVMHDNIDGLSPPRAPSFGYYASHGNANMQYGLGESANAVNCHLPSVTKRLSAGCDGMGP